MGKSICHPMYARPMYSNSLTLISRHCNPKYQRGLSVILIKRCLRQLMRSPQRRFGKAMHRQVLLFRTSSGIRYLLLCCVCSFIQQAFEISATHTSLEGKIRDGTYECIDGKQRLTALQKWQHNSFHHCVFSCLLSLPLDSSMERYGLGSISSSVLLLLIRSQ